MEQRPLLWDSVIGCRKDETQYLINLVGISRQHIFTLQESGHNRLNGTWLLMSCTLRVCDIYSCGRIDIHRFFRFVCIYSLFFEMAHFWIFIAHFNAYRRQQASLNGASFVPSEVRVADFSSFK